MEGGSDNSSIYLHAFLCCIIAYPEVQAKAQKEIDEVIGSHRTPTMEDIDNLPYVQAIMKEVWAQVSPGHVHALMYPTLASPIPTCSAFVLATCFHC